MLQVTIVLVALANLVAGEFDEELNMNYKIMSRSQFIESFNEMNNIYKSTLYPFVPFIRQDVNPVYNIEYPGFDNLPLQIHPPNLPLPENFDLRLVYPECETIREVYNQRDCDSCWAHGVANVASDRICIHQKKIVRLSEQDLECAHENKTICLSGHPWEGFNYWKEKGIVTRNCKPYDPEYAVMQSDCNLICTNVHYPYFNDKHFAKSVYRLPADSYQIKAELVLNGPIHAGMVVHEDMQDHRGSGYQLGIYEHKYGSPKFLHSVRVIGYGVENGVEYWLAANTWGPEWGENGFFRIRSFQKDIHFEDTMCSGLPL